MGEGCGPGSWVAGIGVSVGLTVGVSKGVGVTVGVGVAVDVAVGVGVGVIPAVTGATRVNPHRLNANSKTTIIGKYLLESCIEMIPSFFG